MGDDDHAIHAEQRAAAVTFVGHAGGGGFEGGLQQAGKDLAGQAGRQFEIGVDAAHGLFQVALQIGVLDAGDLDPVARNNPSL